jgi:hypothetical protein
MPKARAKLRVFIPFSGLHPAPTRAAGRARI